MSNTIICCSLMESRFRGYWINRRELQSHTFSMSSRSFDRVLREAAEGGFIGLTFEKKDKRQKLVQPTRQNVLLFERNIHADYKTIVDNSHKLNSFTIGLRDRLAEIEEQDSTRSEDLGWPNLDANYNSENSS
jgi:hypothetical protein